MYGEITNRDHVLGYVSPVKFTSSHFPSVPIMQSLSPQSLGVLVLSMFSNNIKLSWTHVQSNVSFWVMRLTKRGINAIILPIIDTQSLEMLPSMKHVSLTHLELQGGGGECNQQPSLNYNVIWTNLNVEECNLPALKFWAS